MGTTFVRLENLTYDLGFGLPGSNDTIKRMESY